MAGSSSEEDKKVILLQMGDGTRKRITVPKSYRITFGPIVPGAKDSTVNSSGATAVRIWSGSKGNEVQHAVFRNVESFRDMSIPLMEERVESKQETFRREGAEEGDEAILAQVEIKTWVNPDEPVQRPKADVKPVAAGALIELARGRR